jgi:hypothetical protein
VKYTSYSETVRSEPRVSKRFLDTLANLKIGKHGKDGLRKLYCTVRPGHHHRATRHAGLDFRLQSDNITPFFNVVLIAVPITLQVYFNASLSYGLMKLLRYSSPRPFWPAR